MMALLLVAIGYALWSQPEPKSTATLNPSSASAEPAKTIATKTVVNTNPDISISSDTQIPSAAAILNAPLPTTDSLAKEEIDRLADERKRFAEQEALITEQVTMNQQLTDMKAEQIELFEQQVAQLEADAQATVK